MLASAKRGVLSVPFMGVVLLLFSAAFPPFDDAAEVDLTLHMAQHVLIVLAGIAVAYPLYKRGRFARISGRWCQRASLLAVAAALVYWHLPGAWDQAVLNPLVHAVEHGTFFVIGLLIGSALMYLTDAAKVESLLVLFFAHMFYAVLLILDIRIYPLYSTGDQYLLGLVLLLTGPALLVGVAYLLLKDPTLLQSLGGKTSPAPVVSRKELKGPKVPAYVAPAISFLLIGTSAAYFSFTAVAIGSASASTRQGTSVVYIAETPVSWQYSPQDLVVQIGVNNTVEWVSHSISYDTVTSSNGTFRSGTIAPGQTFTYTFTLPGVYPYHCIYHPWMVGRITVLPAKE